MNCWWQSRPYTSFAAFEIPGSKLLGPCNSPEFMSYRSCRGLRVNLKAFARQNQIKRSRKQGKFKKSDTSSVPNKIVLDERNGIPDTSSSSDDTAQENMDISSINISQQSDPLVPSRRAVLQACTITSCLMGALAVIIRQSSHFLHEEGWPIIDCSTAIPCEFVASSYCEKFISSNCNTTSK